MDINTMSIPEIIDTCGIYEHIERGVLTGNLCVRIFPEGITPEDIRARKGEILAYLTNEREAAARRELERQAKIASIPGLLEIRQANEDLDAWWSEFSRSFQRDHSGFDTRPMPEYDLDAMKERYPIAAAYLKAEECSFRSDPEQAAIGQAALDTIIDTPADYAAALMNMEAALKEVEVLEPWEVGFRDD